MVLEFQDLEVEDTSIEEEEEAPDANPQIEVRELGPNYGRFVIGPLRSGYGVTLANPIRRVLYNSLEGTAITSVKIDGALHEYSTLPNIKEEVLELLMNFKAVRLKSRANRPGKLRLEVAGSGEVCAGDIMSSADFEIVNSDLHLATLDSDDSKLSVELNVEQGLGYVEAGSQKGLPIGTLPVDAVYTPIRKVNYEVETTRIGKLTDYELIDIQVWTDGTMTPIEAITKAGTILVNQFFLFSNIQKVVDGENESPSLALKMPVEHYNTVVEDLELSSRTLNCLKRAGLDKVGEVLELDREDLLKIRNFGEKSYRELFDKLREMEILPQELDPNNDNEPAESDVVSEDKG
tara:strand:- start:2153 stop:3199 length:1047 start_codon:yes stop_codon:yes gene_type:complete